MLSRENLQEFTKKYQTVEKNIAREYLQHLFLSSLYKIPLSENLLFKGGTALRFIYESPRFSEDLDFSAFRIKAKEVENIFADALSEIEKTNIKVDIREAKTTTGGYLGKTVFTLFDLEIDIKIDVSFRNGSNIKGTPIVIKSEILPPYTIVQLPQEMMIQGKIQALFARSKPRDFYDFYFILRHPGLRHYANKQSLEKTKDILDKTAINFKEDLFLLLPVSHRLILKDFKTVLTQEINKYL